MSCLTATNCVAVGSATRGAFVAIGNPSKWTLAQLRYFPIDVASGSTLTLTTLECLTSSFCVGFGRDGNQHLVTIEGDPTQWKSSSLRLLSGQATENAVITGISCVTQTFCVAVGYYDPLVDETIAIVGNPANWDYQDFRYAAPNTPLSAHFQGALRSVSCVSQTSCVAVGTDSNYQPLVLQGDPMTWPTTGSRVVDLTSTNLGGMDLQAVKCTSAMDCVAFGTAGSGFASFSGDPSSWSSGTVQSTALVSSLGGGALLDSAMCPTMNFCAGIGSGNNYQRFFVSGDPTHWESSTVSLESIKAPIGSGNWQMADVSCADSTMCAASGFSGTAEPLVLAGAPSRWSQAIANEIVLPGRYGAALGTMSLSCFNSTSCSTLGFDDQGEYAEVTGNPKGWAAATARSIPTSVATNNWIASISCGAATSCLFVGSSADNGLLVQSGSPNTISGSTWKKITFGPAFGSNVQLGGSSCVSATMCVVVGYAGNGNGVVYAGNPTSFSASRIRQIVAPSNAGSLSLSSVDCASLTWCVAVGRTQNGLAVVSGNPATWTKADVRSIAFPSSAGGAESTQVTCVSTSNCAIVGGSVQGSEFSTTGNPATWTLSHIRFIHFAPLGQSLFVKSLACATLSSCIAVGSTTSENAWISAGNPATWTSAQMVTPSWEKTMSGVSSLVVNEVGGTFIVMGSSDAGVFEVSAPTLNSLVK